MKKSLNKHFICFYALFLNTIFAFNCHLPEKCRLQSISEPRSFDHNEKGDVTVTAIMCDINDGSFEFRVEGKTPLISGEKCENEKTFESKQNVILRWKDESTIVDKRFNFSNMYRYFVYFKNEMSVRFWGINGFEINMLENVNLWNLSLNGGVQLSNCRIEFYHNKKRINSCEDVREAKLVRVKSIFQMIGRAYKNNENSSFVLNSVEYKRPICPLVFSNIRIHKFVIVNLVETFYKKNILTFLNVTFNDLNSKIDHLQLTKVHNINLDSNLLNKNVFQQIKSLIITSSSLNSIDGEIFRDLKQFYTLQISSAILKKISHKQGIDWIREINYGLNVNLSNLDVNDIPVIITLIETWKDQRKRLSRIFPDEDFCIYRDFPFRQFVIMFENFLGDSWSVIDIDNELTCTYLWLAQYYESYYELYMNLNRIDYDPTPRNLIIVINSTAFKTISRCHFEKKLSNCNKTNYHRKDIWDDSDFFILNKKIQIAFKISLYPISLLGLITNLIVVLVIVKKENSDLFKEFKQYNYLYLNSIFCILISLIELLSWMTECFYPFEVFCPEIRKLVAIQFFKIIFQECFVTLFRFMCNFTYVAFALNRISLIGKDHGKVVTFMSEVGIKKYIGVTLFISCLLSWIKGFKYEVNYLYSDSNFPMSNELDITLSKPNVFNDFYFIFNLISDLVNYLLFVVICLVIDICMVVQLRRTLEEKSVKSALMNQKQNESKKAENEEAVNKAIKMVVLNSAIGIFFKLPVCIMPLINVYAEFYFKNPLYKYNHPHFGEFYSMLFDTEFYSLIQDVSSFFFSLSLSIQLFIYKRFDKKFRTGFDRIKDLLFLSVKIIFKKS